MFILPLMKDYLTIKTALRGGPFTEVPQYIPTNLQVCAHNQSVGRVSIIANISIHLTEVLMSLQTIMCQGMTLTTD